MNDESTEALLHHYLFGWGFYLGAGAPARLLPAKRQWMRENGLECWPGEEAP